MPLAPSTRLGPYEILAPIGAGSMGEVYRARDPRMGREVAIKLSADRFSDRFEREVRAVASLNHANICQVYDVGPNYLVMELIEGPTLADRMLQGALPLEEALAIARQIGDALEAAHEKGIIHRDLKPANIKIKPDGTVKVLDFGLAKIGELAAAAGNPDESPTVAMGATIAGQIMGTAAYMAPEQARGKTVDKRADIWAFGVLLYEMLTGRRMFEGETISDTLAYVLAKEQDWHGVPQKVRGLLQRCLEKDPKRRLRDIGDAWQFLEDAHTPTRATRSFWRERAGWIAAAALFSVVLWLFTVGGRPHSRADVVRFPVYPPEGTVFSGGTNATVTVPQFALSPDGRNIVFAAGPAGGKPMLWLRTIEEVRARPLAGTEDGNRPFWSPDSQWVGFFAEGKLKKIPAAGGAVQVVIGGIGDRAAFGATWGTGDTILFGFGDNVIQRVPATGGQITPVTKLDESNGETNHRWPQLLPGGDRFLFTVRGSNQRSVFAGSLDGKIRRQLIRFDSSVIYAAPGYLFFVDGDTLLGQAFDADRLDLSGQPFSIAEHVGKATNSEGAVSVSSTGTMAFSAAMLQLGRLAWFDRLGNTLNSISAAADYPDFRLSPDEKRLAASQVDPKTNMPALWLFDLERGSSSRFTEGERFNASAIWSPDGARLIFRTMRRGVVEFSQRSAFGGGNEQTVLTVEEKSRAGMQGANLVPTDWSPNGEQIIYSVPGNTSGTDIWLFPVAGNGNSQKLVSSAADKMHANFSPDRRFLAYSSNESGRFDVYVQTFPTSDRIFTVSTGGGYEPRWRADQREIYYLSLDRQLMAVEVGPGPSFGVPKPLFQTRVLAGVVSPRTHYVPTRDGRRFLINTETGNLAANPITVVLNWTAGLKQ